MRNPVTKLTLLLTALALGTFAYAQEETEETYTIKIAPSTGTFYRDSDGDASNVWKDRWVSTATPTVTLASSDGSTNNMEA
ncbi:MAG: hypothetical protein LUB62_00490, partial [Prevotellaceae bacterium]|nr:hypothetical protein [Prevotellaceae bacterium]